MGVSAAVPMPAPSCVVSGGTGGCRVQGAGGSWTRVRLAGKIQALGFFRICSMNARPLRWQRLRCDVQERGIKCQEKAAFGASQGWEW